MRGPWPIRSAVVCGALRLYVQRYSLYSFFQKRYFESLWTTYACRSSPLTGHAPTVQVGGAGVRCGALATAGVWDRGIGMGVVTGKWDSFIHRTRFIFRLVSTLRQRYVIHNVASRITAASTGGFTKVKTSRTGAFTQI